MKKTAVVVGAVAAALLALGPLANAAPTPKPRAEQVISPKGPIAQDGLINLGDVNLLNGVNVCPGVTAALGLGNVLGILGAGDGGATATGGDTACATVAATGTPAG